MKSKTSPGPFIVVAAAIAALTGGMLLFQRGPATAPQTVAPVTPASAPVGSILPDPAPTPDGVGAQTGHGDAVVYRVATDANGSHLQQFHVNIDDSGKDATVSAVAALNAMASRSDSPLPKGTQAISCRINDGGIATVDFNEALTKNFTGGDEAEALTVNAILATVGQFGAREVQITVAGKKVDSLGGTQSLTAPLPVPQTAAPIAQGAEKQ